MFSLDTSIQGKAFNTRRKNECVHLHCTKTFIRKQLLKNEKTQSCWSQQNKKTRFA